jgi:hypothetical protein
MTLIDNSRETITIIKKRRRLSSSQQYAQIPLRMFALHLSCHPSTILWSCFMSLALILRRAVFVIAVLTRIHNFVLEHLDEFVKEDCDQGANDGPNP